MQISLSMCKQAARPTLRIPGNAIAQILQGQKEKVVVVMGATGAGKSRLSVDLATRFPAEVINSDKMQVYKGLDIATNKITEEERCGVPHHLMGVIDPESDFSAADFRASASSAVRSIHLRKKLPVIAGGSNSFIQALIDRDFRSRYDCCFLWVDVSMQTLHSFVSDRVDRMVERGMVKEVRDLFDPQADYSSGIRRAIGVPELDEFFRTESSSDEETRVRVLAEAIDRIKMNTSKLACRQVEKIMRLRNAKGWDLHRLDATDVFRKSGKDVEAAWENMVAGRSAAIVSRFLYDRLRVAYGGSAVSVEAPLMAAAG
uniref:adenylate dimethylallyltransferase (ADP/ATP-dependent) n=1 Tax=Streptocarpus rexii TaxID=121488 RepID=A0A410TER1_9LAMI|nr:isopentenyltransferase 3 [Streptocarpus rexii]